ncbi:MAG: class I SAM-dependent methyltransferase, partial [Pseudomonadota bacterium]
ILCKTRIYQDLIMKMVGERGELDEPAPGAQILDLGAGTGNLAAHLMEMSPDYRIVALEKNLTMRDMLFDKCERYRATAPNGAGVTIFKQDVTSLNGFDDDSFDYAFMNNVLYAVEDYRGCLEEALRVLRPGGEIRISGPHPTSDAGELFTHLRRDLEHGGHMDRLEKQYSRVKWINKFQLLPKAHKFSTEQLSEILIDVGFSEVIDANYDVYKGQSFMVAARK